MRTGPRGRPCATLNLSHNSGFTMVGICDSIVLVESQTNTKRQEGQNVLYAATRIGPFCEEFSQKITRKESAVCHALT
jgi:hypothetical protein